MIERFERPHDAILALDEVRVLYGQQCVLRVPSLRLNRNGLLLLRGPNASGKSSLMLGLAGIGPKLEGAATFLGIELDTAPAAKRARMGLHLLPQGRRIFPRLTAKEHIILARQQFRENYKGPDVDPPWLERIWECRRPAEDASGGEAKAILLQALLTRKSELVMLDEPFAGLDDNGTANLLDLIHSARSDGVAWLVTDHTGHAEREFTFAQFAEITSTRDGYTLDSVETTSAATRI